MLSRPPIDRIAFLGISWYGLLIVIGILAAFFIASREEKRLGLPGETALDFTLDAIPLGIIGARLYSVLFRLDEYSDNWLAIFNLTEGGLAIYGAVLGGLLAALWVAHRKHVAFLSICDMAAPGLILAQAIGRWGNYFNMEAYGIRINDAALYGAIQFFPLAVEIPVGSGGNWTWYWHLATFFYEFVWNLLVFGALMLMRRKLTKKGDMFCWYVLLYGAGRTVIEGLRDDSLTLINEAARISQILSALACVAVVFYFCFRRFKRLNLNLGLLLASVLLALALCFVGEFERGAYANLFPVSQGLLIALAAVNVVLGTLRLRKRGSSAMKAVPFVLAAVQLYILLLGFGSVYNDYSYFYVSLRQIGCVAQMIGGAALLYFIPARKPTRRARSAAAYK